MPYQTVDIVNNLPVQPQHILQVIDSLQFGSASISNSRAGRTNFGANAFTSSAQVEMHDYNGQNPLAIYNGASQVFAIASTGTTQVTGSLKVSGSTTIVGGLTATSLTGSLQGTATTASNITPAITNNTNNAVLTSNGTGGIVGETNLTFDGTTLTVTGKLANGSGNQTTGVASHAEGLSTQAYGDYSHAEGLFTWASGSYSHAEGYYTMTVGQLSHAEGEFTKTGTTNATVFNSLNAGTLSLVGSNVTSQFPVGCTIYLNDDYNGGAEDFGSIISTVTTSNFSAGNTTITILNATTSGDGITPVTCLNLSLMPASWNGTGLIAGAYSHAEGLYTMTVGKYSHAEGYSTVAIGVYSHAEGYLTRTFGDYSHAEGFNTIALGDYQHVQGKYNATSSIGGAFIHGNGSDGNRRNLIYAHDSIVEITGSVNISGSTTLVGNQILVGTKTITGSVFISGSKTIIGNNIITGSLSVSGSTIFNGNTTITGLLTVTGSFLLRSGSTNDIVGTSLPMVAGKIAVTTTAVTANSKVFVSYNTYAGGGGSGSVYVPSTSIIAGTKFGITSSYAGDTSTVNWFLIN